MLQNNAVPVERRRHPRTQVCMRLEAIRLDPDCGQVVESLRAVDISRSGLGAYSSNAFYPGQRIVLCLPRSPNRGKRNIYATIVRSAPRQGRHRVGLEFDSVSVGASHGVGSGAVAAA